MWVLHERFDRAARTHPVVRAKAAFRDALRRAGARVAELPAHWALVGDARAALSALPRLPRPEAALLNGALHTPDEYAELDDACRAKNLLLLNAPAHYAVARSLERAWPALEGLTPATRFASSPEALFEAVKELGLPVFLKGAVQALKHRGWSHCVARSDAQVARIAEGLWGDHERSDGVVAVRRLVSLRHARTADDGFPLGREYRVFALDGEPLALGAYWPGHDVLTALRADEEAAVRELARTAARRLGVPYLAVDVGQLDDGSWTVIECGDPQFCGFCQVDVGRLAGALVGAVRSREVGT